MPGGGGGGDGAASSAAVEARVEALDQAALHKRGGRNSCRTFDQAVAVIAGHTGSFRLGGMKDDERDSGNAVGLLEL